jgi:hypothetical protein
VPVCLLCANEFQKTADPATSDAQEDAALAELKKILSVLVQHHYERKQYKFQLHIPAFNILNESDTYLSCLTVILYLTHGKMHTIRRKK